MVGLRPPGEGRDSASACVKCSKPDQKGTALQPRHLFQLIREGFQQQNNSRKINIVPRHCIRNHGTDKFIQVSKPWRILLELKSVSHNLQSERRRCSSTEERTQTVLVRFVGESTVCASNPALAAAVRSSLLRRGKKRGRK